MLYSYFLLARLTESSQITFLITLSLFEQAQSTKVIALASQQYGINTIIAPHNNTSMVYFEPNVTPNNVNKANGYQFCVSVGVSPVHVLYTDDSGVSGFVAEPTRNKYVLSHTQFEQHQTAGKPSPEVTGEASGDVSIFETSDVRVIVHRQSVDSTTGCEVESHKQVDGRMDPCYPCAVKKAFELLETILPHSEFADGKFSFKPCFGQHTLAQAPADLSKPFQRCQHLSSDVLWLDHHCTSAKREVGSNIVEFNVLVYFGHALNTSYVNTKEGDAAKALYFPGDPHSLDVESFNFTASTVVGAGSILSILTSKISILNFLDVFQCKTYHTYGVCLVVICVPKKDTDLSMEKHFNSYVMPPEIYFVVEEKQGEDHDYQGCADTLKSDKLKDSPSDDFKMEHHARGLDCPTILMCVVPAVEGASEDCTKSESPGIGGAFVQPYPTSPPQTQTTFRVLAHTPDLFSSLPRAMTQHN